MVTHYKIPHKWHTCYNYKDTVTDKIYFISFFLNTLDQQINYKNQYQNQYYFGRIGNIYFPDIHMCPCIITVTGRYTKSSGIYCIFKYIFTKDQT